MRSSNSWPKAALSKTENFNRTPPDSISQNTTFDNTSFCAMTKFSVTWVQRRRANGSRLYRKVRNPPLTFSGSRYDYNSVPAPCQGQMGKNDVDVSVTMAYSGYMQGTFK
jgi:hypothetical protein